MRSNRKSCKLQPSRARLLITLCLCVLCKSVRIPTFLSQTSQRFIEQEKNHEKFMKHPPVTSWCDAAIPLYRPMALKKYANGNESGKRLAQRTVYQDAAWLDAEKQINICEQNLFFFWLMRAMSDFLRLTYKLAFVFLDMSDYFYDKRAAKLLSCHRKNFYDS